MLDKTSTKINSNDAKLNPAITNDSYISNKLTAMENTLKTDEEIQQEERKKKIIKYGIIGGVFTVLLILLILAIVLSVQDIAPNPKPEPTPPKPFENTNLYKVDFIIDQQRSFLINFQSPEWPKTLLQNPQSLAAPPPKPGHKLDVKPKEIPTGVNNKYYQNISMMFYMVDYNSAYMSVQEYGELQRWRVPNDVLKTAQLNTAMRMEMLGFQFVNNDKQHYFRFNNIQDKNDWLISTQDCSLVFMDKYIQMDFKLPSQRLFGFGERMSQFALQEGSWTMWAKGGQQIYDDGKGGQQSYGVHPFLLIQTKTKSEFIGIYFKNSNAQSPVIKFLDDGTSVLSYITTGGIIEAYFFIKGSVQKIIADYQEKVSGRPNLPPFWSLGFGQSARYNSIGTLYEAMIDNYKEHNIPLETIYVDSQYMNNFTNFEVNQAFNLDYLAKKLHAANQSIIVMIEPGLTADAKSFQFKEALSQQCLIKSTHIPYKDGILSSKVNNKTTVFYDYLHPVTKNVWGSSGLLPFSEKIEFDGLWFDKNELYTQCDGECQPNILSLINSDQGEQDEYLFLTDDEQSSKFLGQSTAWYISRPQDANSTYHLPFTPANQKSYDINTLSLNATHNDTHHQGITEYNLHNMNSYLQTQMAHDLLTNPQAGYPGVDKRPFILSRGTFTGSGKYSSHWLGQNARTWEHMRYSISGIMNMNMFGIQHTGASICGYLGDTPPGYEELCGRWMQLGAFYPLAFTDSEQPALMYNLGEQYKTMVRNALFQRMEYLRLQYTCLFEASNEGKTCFNPLFFHFPDDVNTYLDIEHTFIVANAIKVTPVLEPGVPKVQSYFPKGTWVSMNNFADIIKNDSPANIQLDTNTPYTHVHLMPGAIIPWQQNNDPRQQVKKTYELIGRRLSIVINRNDLLMASGTVFLDTGLLRSEITDKNYNYYEFQLSANTINVLDPHGVKDQKLPLSNNNQMLEELIIVNAADLQNTNFACYYNHQLEVQPLKWKYNDADKTLRIVQDSVQVNFHEIRHIHYGNSAVNYNLCDKEQMKWKIIDTYDLTKSTTSFTIQSRQSTTQQNLRVSISAFADNVINVKMTYAQVKEGVKTPYIIEGIINEKAKEPSPFALSHFMTVSADPFFYELIDLENKVIYSTKDMPLIFQEFLVIHAADLHTPNNEHFHGIYGLGQRTQENFFLDTGIYSMWSRGTVEGKDDGVPPGKNQYGVHPYYMGQWNTKDVDNNHFGVANINPAGQDWYVNNNRESGVVTVKNVLIGGIIDLYIFKGFSPDNVVHKYHKFTSTTMMPPLWALGWHQCRWGYDTQAKLEEVVGWFNQDNIPLDVMWSDIDYMSSYKDFTVDTQNFPSMPDFINKLHANKTYYVPIVDAGIAYRPGGSYEAYNEGAAANVFIKAKGRSGIEESFIGKVWPNEAVFVDFTHPEGKNYWNNQLAKWHDKQMPFDGLWLDMNEIDQFCHGPCSASQVPPNPIARKLTYIPTQRTLEHKSTSLDAYHYDGTLELDQHSLFGYKQVAATHEYFAQRKLRTFILARSTFIGQQKYGAMWLGDNFSKPEFLRYSITGIMMMNIFGMTVAGADICGFLGPSNGELCARWSVVGAFYPFARNHNAYDEPSQEPFVFTETDSDGRRYNETIKSAYYTRYHLSKYMYTQLFQINQVGGTYFKPLFFNFTFDNLTYYETENNILLGNSLKLSVLTTGNAPQTNFYFPQGSYCDIFWKGRGQKSCFHSKGEYKLLASKASDAYVHLIQGQIIPMQNATALNINRIMKTLDHPVDFHIHPELDNEQNLYAYGTMMNDDGLTLVGSAEHKFNTYGVFLQKKLHTNHTDTIIEIHQYVTADVREDLYHCKSVNKNDYVNKLFIYNAYQYGYSQVKYDIIVKDDKGQIMGVDGKKNYYDDVNDEYVIDFSNAPVCLTYLGSIQLLPN